MPQTTKEHPRKQRKGTHEILIELKCYCYRFERRKHHGTNA